MNVYQLFALEPYSTGKKVANAQNFTGVWFTKKIFRRWRDSTLNKCSENTETKHNIPGHFLELHFSVFCDDPEHVRPPSDGEGLSHFRVRFMTPSPHVFVHLVKVLHSPHSPSTEWLFLSGKKKDKKFDLSWKLPFQNLYLTLSQFYKGLLERTLRIEEKAISCDQVEFEITWSSTRWRFWG